MGVCDDRYEPCQLSPLTPNRSRPNARSSTQHSDFNEKGMAAGGFDTISECLSQALRKALTVEQIHPAVRECDFTHVDGTMPTRRDSPTKSTLHPRQRLRLHPAAIHRRSVVVPWWPRQRRAW